MDGGELIVGQPPGFLRHATPQSFCKRCQRVAIFIHDFFRGFHRGLKIGIVWKQLQAAARKLSDMKFLSALDIEPLHKLSGQNEAVGISDSLYFDLHDRGLTKAGVYYMLYNTLSRCSTLFHVSIERFQLSNHPLDHAKPALPELGIAGVEAERLEQFGMMLGAPGRQHGEIALGKAIGGVLVDRIEGVHQTVAERIGIDIERRMDEMRDIDPERLIARLQLDRRAERFARRLVRHSCARYERRARRYRTRSAAPPC